jgi:hypothetical protein
MLDGHRFRVGRHCGEVDGLDLERPLEKSIVCWIINGLISTSSSYIGKHMLVTAGDLRGRWSRSSLYPDLQLGRSVALARTIKVDDSRLDVASCFRDQQCRRKRRSLKYARIAFRYQGPAPLVGAAEREHYFLFKPVGRCCSSAPWNVISYRGSCRPRLACRSSRMPVRREGCRFIHDIQAERA